MKIIIPITPTAQMRDRIRAYKPKGQDKYIGSSYKDGKQASREEAIKELLAPYKPETPLNGPLLLSLRAFLPIPKAKPKWFVGTNAEFQRYTRLGFIRPPAKPDWDNLEKQICDCLTQLRFWHDDAQYIGPAPHSGKYYSEQPRWELELIPYDWRVAAMARGGFARQGRLDGQA